MLYNNVASVMCACCVYSVYVVYGIMFHCVYVYVCSYICIYNYAYYLCMNCSSACGRRAVAEH